MERIKIGSRILNLDLCHSAGWADGVPRYSPNGPITPRRLNLWFTGCDVPVSLPDGDEARAVWGFLEDGAADLMADEAAGGEHEPSDSLSRLDDSLNGNVALLSKALDVARATRGAIESKGPCSTVALSQLIREISLAMDDLGVTQDDAEPEASLLQHAEASTDG